MQLWPVVCLYRQVEMLGSRYVMIGMVWGSRAVREGSKAMPAIPMALERPSVQSCYYSESLIMVGIMS